jgi:uncharacterized membrane protein
MFKIAYQVFIILSLSSGYIVIRLFGEIKSYIKKSLLKKLFVLIYLFFALLLFLVISIYPLFAISSYYNNLKTYSGLSGTKYLENLYPDDSKAIAWINKNISGQPNLLEAQGDSYTDYERISVNTGLPTVIGWTVHEWFWRNDYGVVASRINDVKTIYETNDALFAKQLITRYKVSYVYVGGLERQKYPNLNENKFNQLGKIIFTSGQTKIYKINF